MTSTPVRPWYVLVIVAILAIDGLNAAAQVALMLLSNPPDTSMLLYWQAGVALTAWSAAWAGWQLQRFASALTLLHGMVLSMMLLRLPAILTLEPEAAAPLRGTAAMIFLFVLLLGAGLEWGTRKR